MKIQLKVNGKEISLSEETTELMKEAVEDNQREFEDRDECYVLHSAGDIAKTNFNANYYYFTCLKMGMLFKTREEAEKKRDEMLAIERVKKYIRENFEFEPDWNSDWNIEHQCKWCVCYDFEDNKLKFLSDSWLKNYSPIGYLGSEADCKQLIRSNKEDLEIIFK